jgi:hypothetical protein
MADTCRDFCAVHKFGLFCLSESTASRQPKRVKFDMQAYFNQTKGNMKKKIGVTSFLIFFLTSSFSMVYASYSEFPPKLLHFKISSLDSMGGLGFGYLG